jgi:hypothetical protein
MDAKRRLPGAARERSARWLALAGGLAALGGCMAGEPDSVGDVEAMAADAGAADSQAIAMRLGDGALAMTVAGGGASARVAVAVIGGWLEVIDAVDRPGAERAPQLGRLAIELAPIALDAIYGAGEDRPRALVDLMLVREPPPEGGDREDLWLHWSLAFADDVYPLTAQRLRGLELSIELARSDAGTTAIVRGERRGPVWSWGSIVEVSDVELIATGTEAGTDPRLVSRTGG